MAVEQRSSSLAQRGVTRREAEVLGALAERLTNAEIAERLYLSERTVESHVSSLLRKLGADNRVELGDVAKDVLAGVATTRPAPLPAPLALLADAGPFVGRREELDQLRRTWHRAVEGRLLVGVVTGEAGVGKSRLVAEVAAEVYGAGASVALGFVLRGSAPAVRAVRPGDQHRHRHADGGRGAPPRRRLGRTAGLAGPRTAQPGLGRSRPGGRRSGVGAGPGLRVAARLPDPCCGEPVRSFSSSRTCTGPRARRSASSATWPGSVGTPRCWC